MPHEYPLTYSAPLLRRAVFAFCWRTVGLRFLLAMVALAGIVAWLIWQGDRSWILGLFGAILVLGVALPPLLYLTHYRRALARFRAMASPHATIAVDDSTLTLSSDLGRSEIPWSTVREVWQFPQFWLLMFSGSHYATLPVETVPPDVRTFILRCVEAAGGKISA
jgi:hypothetical protein